MAIIVKHQQKCKESQDKKLNFNQFPLAVWFTGCLIILIGIYLFIHIGSGNKDKFFKGFDEGFFIFGYEFH